MYLLNRNHKKYFVFIALVYLISGITIGFHHSHDNGRHFDCPVCATGYLFSASDREVTNSLVIDFRITYLCPSEEMSRPSLSTFPVHAPRAPPADPLT